MAEIINILNFKKQKENKNSSSVATKDTTSITHTSEHEEPHPVSNIGNTAANQVVSTLLFYANQGFDHGEKARKALLGMQSVVKSQEGSTTT